MSLCKINVCSIHTSFVQHHRANRPPNKTLQAQPPEISPSEAQLPRPFWPWGGQNGIQYVPGPPLSALVLPMT